MKLSSRKELLKESEMKLTEIRTSLNEAVDTSKLDAIKRLRKDYMKSFDTFMQTADTNAEQAGTIWKSFVADMKKTAVGKTISEIGIFKPSGSEIASDPKFNKAKVVSVSSDKVWFNYAGRSLSVIDYNFRAQTVCGGSIMVEYPGGQKKKYAMIYKGGDSIIIKKYGSVI